MELVSRLSDGKVSIFTTRRALYRVTACWLYAEMPCSTAMAVATASLHAACAIVSALTTLYRAYSKRPSSISCADAAGMRL